MCDRHLLVTSIVAPRFARTPCSRNVILRVPCPSKYNQGPGTCDGIHRCSSPTLGSWPPTASQRARTVTVIALTTSNDPHKILERLKMVGNDQQHRGVGHHGDQERHRQIRPPKTRVAFQRPAYEKESCRQLHPTARSTNKPNERSVEALERQCISAWLSHTSLTRDEIQGHKCNDAHETQL